MKFMIVNAFGRSNRGDSVLLDECIAEIKSFAPDANIAGAVFEGIETINEIHPDIEWTERIGNTKIKGVFGRLTTIFYLLIAFFAKVSFLRPLVALLPKSQRDTWIKIVNADYVISAPGGYIHDTNFAYFIALFHIWLGIKKDTKVILAPQSIGPIDNKVSKILAKKVFLSTQVICARESYTYNFLINDLKIDSNLVYQTGDSAFWNFVVNQDSDAISSIYEDIGLPNYAQNKILGLTVVDWSFPKSDDPEKDAENYAVSMAKIIDHMNRVHNCIPVIFNQVSEDLSMAEKVASYASTRILIDKKSREPEVLRALISKSTIFLGTRFHSCIFSMMAGRPTYAVAYLPKTSHILKDLKLDHRQTSIENLAVDKIIYNLENDLKNISSAENEINYAVNNYRKNFAQLRDFL